MIDANDAVDFTDDPIDFFDHSFTKMHSISKEELHDLQLAALKIRFASLRNNVAVLKKVADRLGIENIGNIEDVIPLLFNHTIYKSYPPSFLEQGKFQHLTRWLDGLTTYDISKVDASGCTGVSDWIDLLEKETPIKLVHSSGTTGVMSFIPYSRNDWKKFGEGLVVSQFQKFGEPAPEQKVPGVSVVSPYYRYGASTFLRGNDMMAEFVSGSEDAFYALYPERMDSDVLYLSARIRAAKAKGKLDAIEISPKLQAMQQQFEQRQAGMHEDLEEFFKRVIDELAGKRIYMLSPWSILYDMAIAGEKRGLEAVFSPDSVIFTGGGSKGVEPPENWKEVVTKFLGVEKLRWVYGMSEMCASNPMCDHGHYHIAPWVIPFVLDPDSNEPLPQTGEVTGRFAFYDLIPAERWGGFITGDEVTLNWDDNCPCGAQSRYIKSTITRYSDKRGGDDKINCASTADAHQEALDYLNQSAQKK